MWKQQWLCCSRLGSKLKIHGYTNRVFRRRRLHRDPVSVHVLDGVHWARFALVAVTSVGTILSARLLFYAHFVIHATYYWCVASAVAMAILFVLSICLWRTSAGCGQFPRLFYGVWPGITLFAVGAVVWLMERSAAAVPIAPEKLSAVAVEEPLDGGNTRGPANAPGKNSHVFRSLVFGL